MNVVTQCLLTIVAAYVWVKCEQEEEEDCGAVLEAANIMGRAGSAFSATDRYVRLSLIKSQDDFELLVQRLTELVSLENSSIQTFSIIINILFTINLYFGGGGGGGGGGECALSWSEKAAVEAEAVAAISCSGHGRAYLDGSIDSEGRPVCECYACYTGTDCSQISSNCVADANSGDPIFLEPFWMQHATNSAILVSGWHRMSYRYGDLYMSTELENYIRNMHAVVGNAITEDRYIVFGVGSSQLLSAAVYALSSQNSSSPSNVVASIPFYSIYKTQTVFFDSKSFQFGGDTNKWQSNNSTNNMDVVEFVTSPNNPDGELKKSVLGGKTIYDHAYYWPHFTPIPAPSDHDLMIFTLSKLTGHAGARFGWAVIKDKDVYLKMLAYIIVADLGISKDTQLRVLKLLKVALEDDGKPFFKFAYNKMKDRWDTLTSVFSKSTRFSIQHIHPLRCNFFNVTRLPSPAYAWVKCEREEEEDCAAVLQAANIKGRSGSVFSAKDRYVRLSLIKSQDDFELLVQRLTELVSLENDSIQTFGGGRGERALSWSEKAAAEAEAVAAILCSGHGRAYLDGSIDSEGRPVCECYACYTGIDCSQMSSNCAADANSGDPIFLEPFWMQHAANSAVLISGWHRMSYRYGDLYMSTELENYIRKLHSVVGNAITKDRYIVFGVGSSQLLSAALYAISSQNSSSPSNVVASIPFYSIYKTQTVLFNSENFQFGGDTSTWQLNNSTNNMDVVEFVTSPNNPDGELKKSVLKGKKIYDHAYYWPHFTPIPAPSDHDLMIFTLSKLTGHAGARFGWAVIKDKDIYVKMLTYIVVADLGISKDTQLRVLKLLKVALEDEGKPFFNFAYNIMKDRWDRLTSVFSKSTRFSIQQRRSLHCNFVNETRLPSPAYAWVKCEREEEEDCGAVLEAANIIGRAGSAFSAKDRYVRLSLIKSQDDFELLVQRLTELVSLENGSIQTL
ncbi:hypothetical protein OSB04_025750 [Centaurea solstitialis]|uniref:Uncharacterized protein n=1 Tax=Centaurea solstitialis TaxID=347529 RepID=A0AA38SP93_9ASTR|nr:hypothetical protein OSB04_025750 [Centaurea solstitialis]